MKSGIEFGEQTDTTQFAQVEVGAQSIAFLASLFLL